MNAAVSNLLESYHDETSEGAEGKRRSEKFRMRRINYAKRAKRPTQVNGIHRRRQKKVRV